MLSAYVAASSDEVDRARHVIDALRAAGVEVVSTWVDSPKVRAGRANEGLTQRQREIAAEWCLGEVRRSDVFVLLVPPGPSGIGCGVELGYAIAHAHTFREPLIVAAGRTERTIFAALADVEVATDEEAVEVVVGWARGAG